MKSEPGAIATGFFYNDHQGSPVRKQTTTRVVNLSATIVHHEHLINLARLLQCLGYAPVKNGFLMGLRARGHKVHNLNVN